VAECGLIRDVAIGGDGGSGLIRDVAIGGDGGSGLIRGTLL